MSILNITIQYCEVADVAWARYPLERLNGLSLEKQATIYELATIVGHDLMNLMQSIENAAFILAKSRLISKFLKRKAEL